MQKRRLEEARGEKRDLPDEAEEGEAAHKYIAVGELWQTNEDCENAEVAPEVKVSGFAVNQVDEEEEEGEPQDEDCEGESNEFWPEKVKEGRGEEVGYMRKSSCSSS